MGQCPRHTKFRPDFMVPGPSIKIESKESALNLDADDLYDEEVEEFAALDPEAATSHRYYESDKVLGKLFRDIDERQFFAELQNQTSTFRNAKADHTPPMKRLWAYVQRETLLIQWDQHVQLAREIRESYEDNLEEMMHTYSHHPSMPLTEVEVFAGAILGRSFGAQSKRMREYANEMKERFERDVAFTVERIVEGDEGRGKDEEALPRAIACLAVGMKEDGLYIREMGHLQSWKYVAGAICLRQLERLQTGFGPLKPL